jgi:t-SNARE complex subunit (syntaxin)
MIQSEDKNYLRDPKSKALINTNISALTEYKKRKQQIEKVRAIECEVADLKNDMQEIKLILKQLVDR